MPQSTQLKLTNCCVAVMAFLTAMGISTKISANDSVYVKFIDRSVAKEYSDFAYLTHKKNAYLFIFRNDSTINCFVMKRNRLLKAGNLKVYQKSGKRYAERNGYWREFRRNQYVRQVYYYQDAVLKEEGDVLIEN